MRILEDVWDRVSLLHVVAVVHAILVMVLRCLIVVTVVVSVNHVSFQVVCALEQIGEWDVRVVEVGVFVVLLRVGELVRRCLDIEVHAEMLILIVVRILHLVVQPVSLLALRATRLHHGVSVASIEGVAW